MYNESLKFNQIRDNAYPSNKFSYHLNALISEGLIKKENEQYTVTNEGVRVLTYLDGVKIENKKKPIVGVFILGHDTEKDLILLNERSKQPFLGYFGVPGGKLELGVDIEEQDVKNF